ncbi:YtxH domain-containing protein [Sphaerimonospora sp. CA-214678]|uniref:YtxH domain-containing protein n=1 Tax=Sphaerimonospora sp. CA-214678 TaxID=3240029 RepID=UPI003D90C4C7
MRYKMMFAAGLTVGYVLGTRAGRERYEQIKRMAQRVADSPTVQEAAGLVGAQAAKMVDRVPFLRRHDPWETERIGVATGWPGTGPDSTAGAGHTTGADRTT